MEFQTEREKRFMESFDRERCIHRKKIPVQFYHVTDLTSKPCCTHPNGPKVTCLLGIPDPDPWYCDAAIEAGKCPLDEVDKK